MNTTLRSALSVLDRLVIAPAMRAAKETRRKEVRAEAEAERLKRIEQRKVNGPGWVYRGEDFRTVLSIWCAGAYVGGGAYAPYALRHLIWKADADVRPDRLSELLDEAYQLARSWSPDWLPAPRGFGRPGIDGSLFWDSLATTVYLRPHQDGWEVGITKPHCIRWPAMIAELAAIRQGAFLPSGVRFWKIAMNGRGICPREGKLPGCIGHPLFNGMHVHFVAEARQAGMSYGTEEY